MNVLIGRFSLIVWKDWVMCFLMNLYILQIFHRLFRLICYKLLLTILQLLQICVIFKVVYLNECEFGELSKKVNLLSFILNVFLFEQIEL